MYAIGDQSLNYLVENPALNAFHIDAIAVEQ